MNAVAELVACLQRPMLAGMLGSDGALAALSTAELRRRLRERFALDLVAFLNRARRPVLECMARGCRLHTRGSIGDLRARLWMWGARIEAGGPSLAGTALQPAPIALAGKLVMLGPPRGRWSPRHVTPWPVGPAASPPDPVDEPACLEDLLGNADRLIGVRLGRARRHKGAFGAAVARMLGVKERNHAEPDWRGEVEIKTVPVVRDRAGWWRVKEDPAVGMASISPLAKLGRVLWIARAADMRDSAVLGWYYQERDPVLRRMAARYLHIRPKGRAGTRARGWYLHRRFFVESGFLRVLNG